MNLLPAFAFSTNHFIPPTAHLFFWNNSVHYCHIRPSQSMILPCPSISFSSGQKSMLASSDAIIYIFQSKSTTLLFHIVAFEIEFSSHFHSSNQLVSMLFSNPYKISWQFEVSLGWSLSVQINWNFKKSYYKCLLSKNHITLQYLCNFPKRTPSLSPP